MSKVEVNQVTQQCGTTLTVGGGACKTAVVDATTVTLGRCGGTVSLASGATQSGFGRTGTVDWETSIQTGTVTAATGKGYFVNTTSGEISVNLPAGAAGSIVAVSDYASTAASNNIIIDANASEKINGDAGTYVISTAGLAVTLVYADAARGWKSVTGSDADATGVTPTYIAATGGNQPTAGGCIVCTNYKFHKFTSPGTFCVSAGVGDLAVFDYMVIAGGGGGGTAGGGGGAGGYRESKVVATSGCWTASPLAAAVSIPVTVQGYPITVGGGGAGWPGSPSNQPGARGSDSIASTITSTGGGGGRGHNYPDLTNAPGGSGGGGGSCGSSYPAGVGNTPPTSPAQGTNGSPGASPVIGGAGGGATVAGACQNGGNGATNTINATPTVRAGGGGGGPNGCGGTGGGGCGASDPTAAPAGTVNTGSGGGGSWPGNGGTTGGNGGSGVVIIRYKFQ